MDHKTKTVWTVEMFRPWIEHREKKSKEKTAKYGPLRFQLKKQYPGYDVEQCNINTKVLGGWSSDLELTIRKLFGSKGYDVLRMMRKATISNIYYLILEFEGAGITE